MVVWDDEVGDAVGGAGYCVYDGVGVDVVAVGVVCWLGVGEG